MSDIYEDIIKRIDSCPDRWEKDHWLLCDRCRPDRKKLKAIFAGGEFKDWFENEHYFQICDNCGETYPATVEYGRCVKCKNERLRKELRPDVWEDERKGESK